MCTGKYSICHTMDTHQLRALISDVTGRLNDAVAGAHKHIYDNVIFDQVVMRFPIRMLHSDRNKLLIYVSLLFCERRCQITANCLTRQL